MRELIELAKQAGFDTGKMISHDYEVDWVWPKDHPRKSCVIPLETFAKLVAEREREAIIDLVAMYGGLVDLEAAIRARGEK